MHTFWDSDLADRQIGDLFRLDRNEENHFFKILRAAVGDRARLFNGRGLSAVAAVEPGRMLRLLTLETMPEPSRHLHLYVAPPRRQKMDVLLKQCAELGVWRIVPVLAERSVSEPDANSIDSRWRELLVEGCKQAQNPFLPLTSPPLRFPTAVQDARATCAAAWYGSPTGSGGRLEQSPLPAHEAVFVGPEGGFSPDEEACLATFCRPLRIGRCILRVETAAVALLAVLSARAAGE